jgi:hypothetical protein
MAHNLGSHATSTPSPKKSPGPFDDVDDYGDETPVPEVSPKPVGGASLASSFAAFSMGGSAAPSTSAGTAAPKAAMTAGRTVIGERTIGAVMKPTGMDPAMKAAMERNRAINTHVVECRDTRRAVNVAGYMTETSTGYSFTKKGMINNIDLSRTAIGIGPPKKGTAGRDSKTSGYCDVVLCCHGMDKNAAMLPQFYSDMCVIEGVGDRPEGRAQQAQRRLGEHFVRVGLPAAYFVTVMNGVQKHCGIKQLPAKVTEFNGYYWLNASWGVSSNPATYSYMGPEGTMVTAPSLISGMAHLEGKSVMGLMVVAISISAPWRLDGAMKEYMDLKQAELSVKCHNFIERRPCDLRGPPQVVSAGIDITDLADFDFERVDQVTGIDEPGAAVSFGAFSTQQTASMFNI